ncbi:MAG: Crp/Fnr family transcriptional regulator [Synechococcus sp.]|nr:Crp/Fnr family transcriptional regulator [Synechococcus sp.]
MHWDEIAFLLIWLLAMHATMTARDLHLNLQASAVVPSTLNWRIDDGYLRIASWNEQGDSVTFGLWGPGDLVIPSLIMIAPLQLLSLSAARVQEVDPSPAEREQFLLNQSLQIATLLRLSRTRPAELRLFQLLLWIGQKFGRVSQRGVSLSFEDLNLTHRHLAEISGLTRVTVTKALSLFRQKGYLLKQGSDELLLPEALPHLQRNSQGNMP